MPKFIITGIHPKDAYKDLEKYLVGRRIFMENPREREVGYVSGKWYPVRIIKTPRGEISPDCYHYAFAFKVKEIK